MLISDDAIWMRCKKHGDLNRNEVYINAKSNHRTCKYCVYEKGKKRTQSLPDTYVIKLMGLSKRKDKNIPKEVIELKRAQIMLKRAAKQKEHEDLEAWLRNEFMSQTSKIEE